MTILVDDGVSSKCSSSVVVSSSAWGRGALSMSTILVLHASAGVNFLVVSLSTYDYYNLNFFMHSEVFQLQ